MCPLQQLVGGRAGYALTRQSGHVFRQQNWWLSTVYSLWLFNFWGHWSYIALSLLRCFKKLSRALLWLAASFKYWLGLLLCDGVGCGGLTRPWPWNRERRRPIAAPASEYIQDTSTHPHHPNSPYPPPPLTTRHSIYRRQGWKQFHIKIYINWLESSNFLHAYFFML